MKEHNEILDLSFQFSIRVVKLYQYLCQEKKEYILSKQLLRSGTSIGANINEAQAAISPKDFHAKLTIAAKEARESKYWIDLLIATDYLSQEKHVLTLQSDILSIIKLLTAIVKSTKV